MPSFIRLLTGISDDMLFDAPPIEEVLPNFIEFLGGSVLVAHNARFDVSFLNSALARNDYATITNQVVDTAQLARRILQGEVRNNKLETLAHHLRCAHKPCHRAFLMCSQPPTCSITSSNASPDSESPPLTTFCRCPRHASMARSRRPSNR